MRRRLLLLPLLALAIFGASLAPAPPASRAQPAGPPGLDVVQATYAVLLDQFFRPLDPGKLLTEGWNALTDALVQEKLAPPPTLPPLPVDRDAALAAFSAVYARYVAQLPADLTAQDVAFAIASGMADSVQEGHTGFLPPASYRSVLGQLGGNQLAIGLGVGISLQPPFLVSRVAPDGPADKAGMVPGDIVVGVDGKDVSRGSRRDLSAALAGPAGADVRVTVDRDGERTDLTITRGPYYFPPLESKLLPGGIGYLKLESFTVAGVELPNKTELLSDLDRRLDAFDAAGATGLILDIRDNGGGDVFTSTEILGRFLPEDVITSFDSDERGREASFPTSGQMRRVQLPMALLINGGSYSSSEVTASALKESGRAVLVGESTGGVLATAQILPLPEGAGIEVAVAQARSGLRRTLIDEVGVPADVIVHDSRTAADYLAGRDPQLEAAIAALAQAPAPPAYRSTLTSLSVGELQAAFAPMMPAAAEMPRNDRLTDVKTASARTLTHPNQWTNYFGPTRDGLSIQATQRERGYQGSYVQEYGLDVLVPPGVNIIADRYATSEGAAAALQANDFPDLYTRTLNPLTLGDQTATFRGQWLAQGSILIQWRHGRDVLSVSYFDLPGLESMDTAVAVARLIDARYQALGPAAGASLAGAGAR